MFNNLLSTTNSWILLIYLIFLGILLLSIVFSRLLFLVWGLVTKTQINGQQLWNDAVDLQKYPFLKVKITTNLFQEPWLGFDETKNELFLSEKRLGKNNLFILTYLLSNIASIKRTRTENQVVRWQAWGLFGVLGAIFLLGFLLLGLLILGPKTANLASGRLTLGTQIGIQGLIIMSWFLMVVLLIWWVTLHQKRNEDLLVIAKKTFVKVDYDHIQKYLTFQSYFPFSVRIYNWL